jgi:hypothetical protein
MVAVLVQFRPLSSSCPLSFTTLFYKDAKFESGPETIPNFSETWESRRIYDCFFVADYY